MGHGRGSHNTFIVYGDCDTANPKRWIYNGTGKLSKTFFYSLAEASLRAERLVGQYKKKYESYEVITFAMMDSPYYLHSCSQFLTDKFPNAPYREPGAIIVGRDGAHCGILDKKARKFIHTNPYLKKVTHESIAALPKYFRRGVVLKRFPHKFPF
eukprot:TRINITY_DN11783_c0_g1_i1.p1 TRINITY_DN11783_c0_g1~~TRINITY_DN11783_c0_g1_i1.p1  ORF type:complete len:155 (-),score=23.58 TRINITY_DN11783_c0_g1_i1:185-649(-)